MTTKKNSRFTVIENTSIVEKDKIKVEDTSFHSNPFYEKLLNFRNLQEQQKKRFSPDDLFKLC